MSGEHDELRDLLAPVALGAADPGETARVEAHVARCATCREELAGLRAGADVLAVAVPQREPSPGVRDSLMATVRAEAASTRTPRRPARARGGLRSWVPSLRSWPAVATIAMVAAVLLGWNVALQVRSGSGAREQGVTALSMSGTTDAPGLTGRVVYVPREDTAVVRLSGLPALRRGDAYQLWVLRGSTATSAGLFEPSGPARAVRVASGLEGADALAVTAQPRADLSAPQGPILARVAMPGG